MNPSRRQGFINHDCVNKIPQTQAANYLSRQACNHATEYYSQQIGIHALLNPQRFPALRHLMYDDKAFEEFVQEKLSCGEIRPCDNIPVTTFGRGTTTTDKECTYTVIVKYKGSLKSTGDMVADTFDEYTHLAKRGNHSIAVLTPFSEQPMIPCSGPDTFCPLATNYMGKTSSQKDRIRFILRLRSSMNITMCQGPGNRSMDPFLRRNSLRVQVTGVDSDDYVTTHMIQGGGELLDWDFARKSIMNSAQTQTLGAADLSYVRQDWGSVLAQNGDGSCTRTCSYRIRVPVGCAKRFCKTMKHACLSSGVDSPFTRGCILVLVLCFSTKEGRQRKHSLALSTAVLEQNAYLNTR